MKKLLAVMIACALSLSVPAQEIKQYSGDYPNPFRHFSWCAGDPKASYSYYDDPSGSGRIFHGPFKLRFIGDNPAAPHEATGFISGNFKDDLQEGEWSIIYPEYYIDSQCTGVFKCTFEDGRINGDATYVLTDDNTGKIRLTQKVHLTHGKLDGPFESVGADAQPFYPAATINGAFKDDQQVGTWSIQHGQDQYLIDFTQNGKRAYYKIDHRTGDKCRYGSIVPMVMESMSILSLIKIIPMRKSAVLANPNPEPGPGPDALIGTVEQMPYFPGGDPELYRWVESHIRYPESAVHAVGRVIVQFVIKTDGSIGEVKVIRGLDPDFDREAIRVVKSLPKFIPGKMNGQTVNVWYTLPINFR